MGRTWHWTTPRALTFLVVLLGATLVPLSLEVLWRADTGGTAHVQPEVTVVEHAGKLYGHGRDPYQKIDVSGGRVKAPPGEPVYDLYNPYLPLMSVFGIASGTDAPRRLTDARVGFSVVTMLVVVAALALCRGPSGPRVLALQSMTVLPTAALPLATGGDDLPVAAFLLLGLVLLQRRRPLWSGIASGVAASMKITAWPLAALAFLVARDRHGERGRRPSLLVAAGIAGVMIPAVLPTAASNFSAFVDNVVRFPLGLAGVSSPAGTPLIGHVVVSLFPGAHRAFTVAVAGVGSLALLFVLVRHTPRTPAALSRLVGWVMTVAIVLAPATRIGYLLYPVDFFVWAWLLRQEDAAEHPETEAVAIGAAAPRDGRRAAADPEPAAPDDPGGAPRVLSPVGARPRSPTTATRGRCRRRRTRRRPEPPGARGQSSSDTANRRTVNGVDCPAPVGKRVGDTVTPISHSWPSLAGCCPTTMYPGALWAGPWLTRRQCSNGSCARKKAITWSSVAATPNCRERS